MGRDEYDPHGYTLLFSVLLVLGVCFIAWAFIGCLPW